MLMVMVVITINDDDGEQIKMVLEIMITII